MQEYYSQHDKIYLLKLARDAIKEMLFNDSELKIDEAELNKKFLEKRGVFVTLTINKELRGCIGSLEARDKLYKSVIDNAINAAFQDPRFYPLDADEFEKIKIEISVLTPMKPFDYKNKDELISSFNKNKPGVYISKNGFSATYLPQVWEHFSSAEEFLSSLCEKAGMNADEWQKDGLKVSIYSVESFEED